MFYIFQFVIVMKYPCGDVQQGIRNLGLELEKGTEGKNVHMRIIFVGVTFEEKLIFNCDLDQEQTNNNLEVIP